MTSGLADQRGDPLRVALISYEYPPALAVGGIGTYAWHASHMLAHAGDAVDVFTAGTQTGSEQPHPRIRVHRLDVGARAAFAAAIVPTVRQVHESQCFQVIEAPEIGAEGGPTFEALPEVARVVKLHTPSFLVQRIGTEPPTLFDRMRFTAGALRRGRWQTLPRPAYHHTGDPEWRGALLADEIAAPSRSIAALLTREWHLPQERLSCFPLPFDAPARFLDLPIPTAVRTVGFVGRLEPRKGIVELVRALPAVLRQAPALRFRFIGPSWPYRGTDMRTWIERHFPAECQRVDFTGAVAPAAIPEELARCDVVVLPSRWENYPFACWEALASGRAVIGAAAGGMGEVIEPGVSGLLVEPNSPQSIARNVIDLVKTPGAVARFGAAGRARVKALLSPEHILPLQHDSYRRAILRAIARRSVAIEAST